MAKMAAIYGIRASADRQYFYIGSTKYEAEKRFGAHMSLVRLGKHHNLHFQNKVKKLNFDVTVDVIQEVEESEQFDVEEKVIKQYVKDGHKLVNRMHNGFSLSLVPSFDEREDYAERHYRTLTPEKFWAGYRMTQSCDVPRTSLEAAFLDVLRNLMSTMLSRYPDEVKRDYGWQLS
jgi:hypothetical protein